MAILDSVPHPLAALGAILAYVTLGWVLSVRLGDASIVDIMWGGGFVLQAWVYYWGSEARTTRGLLIAALVTVWGVRLAGYLFQRNAGKGEDYRYQRMRAKVGPAFWWRSFVTVFVLQGLLMWVIAMPLFAAQRTTEAGALSALDFAGAALWAIGLFFEVGGDAQLVRFKRDTANKGKLLTTGLWKYTRHPNYFGDAAMWWGLYLIAVAAGGWWTIFGPILMTYFLLKVSGAALLERGLKKSKPGYEDYMRRTSGFVPWPPKRSE